MGELTRFRLLRNPGPEHEDSPRVRVRRNDRDSVVLRLLTGMAALPGPERLRGLRDALAEFADFGALDDDTIVRAARAARSLTTWLRRHPRPDPGRLRDWWRAELRRQDFGDVPDDQLFTVVVAVGDWARFLDQLEDRTVLAATKASVTALEAGSRIPSAPAADAFRESTALLRVATLVDRLAVGAVPLDSYALHEHLTCPVILPQPPFPLLDPPRTAGPARRGRAARGAR